MTAGKGAPVPIPLKGHLKELRLRLLPVLVFSSALFGIAVLWEDHVAAPTIVGQAEPVILNVCSSTNGVLTRLNGAPSQRVKKDDVLGEVVITDPGRWEPGVKPAAAELTRAVLKAPIDGIVTAVLRHSGEAVTAGQPILSIATFEPVRIVGYVRPSVVKHPQAGMPVEVRTRGLRRATGKAQIVEVGTGLEQVPPSLLEPVRRGTGELGLPVDISLPANLNIRPGELVDIVFLSKAD